MSMFRSTSPPPQWGSPKRSRSPAPSNEDPFFREKVGQHSWAVMHAVAENFPDYPTQRDQQAANAFMQAFADVYPCSSCRGAFQELLRQFPPETSSRQAFIQWMECFHDQINMHLGKPAVNTCGWPQALPTRQGDGHGAHHGMNGMNGMSGMGMSGMNGMNGMGSGMGSPMMGMSGMGSPSSPSPHSYPINFSSPHSPPHTPPHTPHQHSPARPMSGYHGMDGHNVPWLAHGHSAQSTYQHNHHRVSRRSVQPIPLNQFGSTMSL